MSTMHYYKGKNPKEKTIAINMRVSPAFLRLVEEWRRKQPLIPSRSEAIRRMIEIAAQKDKL